jgi:hypothetical protein
MVIIFLDFGSHSKALPKEGAVKSILAEFSKMPLFNTKIGQKC